MTFGNPPRQELEPQIDHDRLPGRDIELHELGVMSED